MAVAKTYVEINPTVKLVVLDVAKTVGGTWAKERLYPSLRTNNLLGTYEFSDFPMDGASFGVKSGEHIPGSVVHEYLHRYAEKFDIYRHIRFQSMVDSVERQADGGWVVTIAPGHNKTEGGRLYTRKLVIATGLTSEPFLPNFAGRESFNAPLFHCKYFPEHVDHLLKSAKNVVIFGASKFALDMIYALASEGIEIDWIIRKSGQGPNWFTPPLFSMFKIWIERLVNTRILTWFSPCSWGDVDGYGSIRRLLHGTSLGRWIVDRFWAVLTDDFIRSNGFDRHPETAKLKPWTSPFWHATDIGFLNYPTDVYEFIRTGLVRVHIEDVSRLSSKTVHLSSGTSLKTDALICSTGWKHRPPVKFLPEGDEARLGLPYRSDAPEEDIVQAVDDEILKRFPRLRSPPDTVRLTYEPLTGKDVPTWLNRPYRLYRFMVPPAFLEDRNIAYTGFLMTFSNPLNAQIQALWLTAYLEGKLPLDRLRKLDKELAIPEPFDSDPAKWDTILHSQFGKWRCPEGKGSRHPDYVFDTIPYIDRLLRDLGLEYRRKGGLLAECFTPYTQEDYRGLVDEWRTKVN